VVVALIVLLAGRAYFTEEPETEVATPTPVAPVLVAVDGSARGIVVTAAAASYARQRGAAVEVLHVHETDVLGEQAVDRETGELAAATLARRLAQLQELGITAGGEVLHTYGDHEDVVQAVLKRIDDIGAQAVVVGRRGRVAETAKVPVIVVPS
jgi:nucleotide-binding universal stress UspA family protein